jgi:hypothetical protein
MRRMPLLLCPLLRDVHLHQVRRLLQLPVRRRPYHLNYETEDGGTMSARGQSLENGCAFCEFIRLTYPKCRVDNQSAFIFVIKHLALEHDYHLEAGEPGISP